jgi:DNA-directed RNA polymerase subunit RPC12/RpoP
MKLIDLLNEGKKKSVSKKKAEKKPAKKSREKKSNLETGEEPGKWIGADSSEKEEYITKPRPITFKEATKINKYWCRQCGHRFNKPKIEHGTKKCPNCLSTELYKEKI